MKTFSILEAKRESLATANALLAEAARLVFEAQLHLGNGIESAARNRCQVADAQIQEARSIVKGVAERIAL